MDRGVRATEYAGLVGRVPGGTRAGWCEGRVVRGPGGTGTGRYGGTVVRERDGTRAGWYEVGLLALCCRVDVVKVALSNRHCEPGVVGSVLSSRFWFSNRSGEPCLQTAYTILQADIALKPTQ